MCDPKPGMSNTTPSYCSSSSPPPPPAPPPRLLLLLLLLHMVVRGPLLADLGNAACATPEQEVLWAQDGAPPSPLPQALILLMFGLF